MYKLRLIQLIIAAIIVFSASSAQCAVWLGSGTIAAPYQIWDANDLEAIGTHPNAYTACFKLMADIDLQGRVYNQAIIAPDANNATEDFDGDAFQGMIDGDGHFIDNFTIEKPIKNQKYELRYFGLIGQAGGAIIMNLEVKNARFNFNQSGSTFSDVFANGAILLGRANHCEIKNCKVSGDIITSNHQNLTASNIGGIVGFSKSSDVNNCEVQISINSDILIDGSGSTEFIGGLCGTSVDHSRFTNNNVYGYFQCMTDLGGLVGSVTKGTISNCSFKGYVESGNSGGLIAWADSTDISCCSANSASSNFNGNYSGGIVGKAVNSTTISDCYSLGRVYSDKRSGGIVGVIEDCNVVNCYSASYMAGDIFASDYYAGGIAGFLTNSNLTNCFFDIFISYTPWEIGNIPSYYGNITISKGLDMQLKSTYVGWDFENTWFIIEGKMYPILRWQATAYQGDANIDGKVDFQDFAKLAENWLKILW